MRFSDRIGKTTPKSLLQVDGIDDELQNSIWNVLNRSLLHVNKYGYVPSEQEQHLRQNCNIIIEEFFKIPIEDFGDHEKTIRRNFKPWYFKCIWYEIYNILEFIAERVMPNIVKTINFILEREKSAYRFIDKKIVAISDELEVEAVSNAANLSDKYSGPREHIRRALDAYSTKPDGDYLTAIKEAISAVEGIAKIISGKEKAALGDALNEMEKQKPMHGAFKESFKMLYGYTSDEQGIRHALMTDDIRPDEADAHFMIVACSAFVNFAVSRYQ